MIKFDESLYGRKVRFINAKAHKEMPQWFPEVGTIGIIIPVIENSSFSGIVDDFVVQWPKGSTSSKDIWAADEENLELVEENNEV